MAKNDSTLAQIRRENPHIKGLDRGVYELLDLLPGLPSLKDRCIGRLTQDQRDICDAIKTHAENCALTVRYGIEAVGAVSAAAYSSDTGVDASASMNLSYLVAHLANELHAYEEIAGMASEGLTPPLE